MTAFSIDIAHPRKPSPAMLTLEYPALPVTDALQDLLNTLRDNQVVIVVGETGSGKTTQLPKLCLQLGRGRSKQIVHTQPRRLAARSVASRIAEELNSPLGELCGYQVRFDRKVSDQTAVKLVTDGVLLAEFRADPLLKRYDTIIIDEAHERSLNIDFILGILVSILPKRPDLKVIITSATINYEKFGAHFGNAPVIEVSGRAYPVEIRYSPVQDLEADKFDSTRLALAVQRAIFELRTVDRESKQMLGDILVFLPGEREIRDVSQFLRTAAIDRIDVLPLYARLGAKEQNRIFYPTNQGIQRVVLATNVAETSLTVPGIRYVIDSGLVRISRYSPRSRIQRLPIEPVSQASANQRSGRCGRTEAGIAVRLYDSDDFATRPQFTDPEILRTNLASVVLQCLDLKLGNPLDFSFVDPPESQSVRDGFNQLKELDLVSSSGQLTGLGQAVAALPLDPRIGRILLEAKKRNVFWEVSVVAAALSVQDPREPGFEIEGVRDVDSEFIGFLNLWCSVEAERVALTHSKFRGWCQSVKLNFNRLREWREIHRQILLCFPEIANRRVSEVVDRVGLHTALLTGLGSQIGRREEQDYLGVRNRRFRMTKGVVDGKPSWVMAAQLVETHRVVARTIAAINPQWVIAAVPRLLKYDHQEPFWSKSQGRVLCYRTTRLFGLTLRERETVGFRSIDARQTRDIFLSEGVIFGKVKKPLPFMIHNQMMFEQAQDVEAKLRRVDVVRSPDDLRDWFNERIPVEITDLASLTAWWKRSDKLNRDRLYVQLSDLVLTEDTDSDLAQYPEQVVLGHLKLPAEYQFKPGKMDDGISVKVPLSAVMQLNSSDLEWTVPGALAEKAEALVRSLPKSIRRQLVPIPDFVRNALPQIDPKSERLTDGLARLINRHAGIAVDQSIWSDSTIDDRLKVRIQVVDSDGRMIDSDRDLAALKARIKDQIPQRDDGKGQVILHDWPIGLSFPDSVEVIDGGVKMRGYPRLSCSENGVNAVTLFDSLEANLGHIDAVASLLVNQCMDQFRLLKTKEVIYQQALVSICHSEASEPAFQRALVMASVPNRFDSVLDASAFLELKQSVRAQLVQQSIKIAGALVSFAQRSRDLKQRLSGKIPPSWIQSIGAMNANLDTLTKSVLLDTPPHRLMHLARYAEAIEVRLEKLSSRVLLDLQWQREIDQLWADLEALWFDCPKNWSQQDARLVDIRWQIEEFRVLCFAQTLKSSEKVSFKRVVVALKDYRNR